MTENQQFLLYTAPDGAVRVEVFFKDETVWLTQKALAELDNRGKGPSRAICLR